jgi:DNA-binding GntR family transcriptional regulator
VSRTPVREALRRLEADGLVHIAPRRGALITELALEELDEVYDIRVALETLAATRAIGRITPAELAAARAALADGQEAVARGDMEAAMRANDRFHQLVYGAARSPRLWGLIADLGNVIRRYRHASISRPGRAALVLQQHAQQLAASESRSSSSSRSMSKGPATPSSGLRSTAPAMGAQRRRGSGPWTPSRSGWGAPRWPHAAGACTPATADWRTSSSCRAR